MIVRFVSSLALALAISAPSIAATTTGADATNAFFNLCGGTVAQVEMPLDISAFEFTKLDATTFKKVRPTENGPYWDVQSRKSDLRALVHIWSNGNCTLEIVESDERATRAAFEAGLAAFAASLQGTLERRPDKVEMKDKLPMTSSEWMIESAKGSYLLGLTTYPEPRYMTQHIMLMRRTK